MKKDINIKLPKRVVIIGLIICGSLLYLILLMYKMTYYRNKSNSFYAQPLSDAAADILLTSEEKEADVRYLFSVLENNSPSAYVKTDGKSVLDNKDFYIDAAINTSSDYDFFCVLYSILSEIPSCHTVLVSSYDLDTIKAASFCYNSQKALSKDNLTEKLSYWNKLINENALYCDTTQRIQFNYVAGQYVCSPKYSNLPEDCDSCILTSVNDTAVDEYIKPLITCGKISYDSINHKWYRRVVAFNSKVGDKVTLNLVDKDGNTHKITAFRNYTYESAFVDKMLSEADKDTKAEKCYSIDVSDDICYLNITSFMDISIKSLPVELREAGDYKAIVIDLRENAGGFSEYAVKYLYPILYESNSEIAMVHHIKHSDTINRLTDINVLLSLWNATPELIEDAECSGLYYKQKISHSYEGMAASEKPVYILTGKNTCSAADVFASDMKACGKAVLIGENTGGEGNITGYCMDTLPNSGLLFTYNPSYSLNSDMTDNSAYGTSPDIYSRLSADNYFIKEKMLCDDINPYTYENRLKWDNVLTEALKIIKEDKNDQTNNSPHE